MPPPLRLSADTTPTLPCFTTTGDIVIAATFGHVE